MWLAEHKSEGNNEELFAEVVVDVQDPTAPIFGAARCSEGPYDLSRVITRFSEIVDYGAMVIDQNFICVGAVEINLGHVQSPSNWTGRIEMSLSQVSWAGRAKDKNEDAVMIWSHIQLVMSGKRIISAPITIAGKKWGSTAAFRRHQFIDGVDLGIEQSEIPLGAGAPCGGLPQQYGFIE
jgi:hypothetical protein